MRFSKEFKQLRVSQFMIFEAKFEFTLGNPNFAPNVLSWKTLNWLGTFKIYSNYDSAGCTIRFVKKFKGLNIDTIDLMNL